MVSYWRVVLSVAFIMACRLLGLFMILPVFAQEGAHLAGATAINIGFAMGVYGLLQGCLQIPMGALSDKYGRRLIITAGLSFFAIGSVVAALSSGICGVIIGRALQGAGAVGSSLLALLSDFIPDERRSTAMATVGAVIGLSFLLALIIGPTLVHHLHLSGLFWLMLLLAIMAIAVLWLVLPKPERLLSDPVAQGVQISAVDNVRALFPLWGIDLGILLQHAIMTALFVVLPVIFKQTFQLSYQQQSFWYLILLFVAFVMILPGVIYAERRRQMRLMLRLGVLMTAVSCLAVFCGQDQLAFILVALLFYFAAFTLLESLLPSCVAKMAPLKLRGVAMGIYSSAQYLGIFIGGCLGGWLMHWQGVDGVLISCVILGCIWSIIVFIMPRFDHTSTLMFSLSEYSEQQRREIMTALKCAPGVVECAMQTSIGLLYLKVDKNKTGTKELRKRIEGVSV